jgi:MFS family permease
MVAEMVPEKELQPRAFSIMPLVWSMGSVLGPSFGGSLAQPAKRFPDVFGNIEYFRKFPFALPNLVATVFFLISAASAALFLKETLPTKRGGRDWGLLVGKRLTRAVRPRPQASRRRSSFVDGEATAPLLPSKSMPKKFDAHQSSPGMKDVFTYQTSLNLVAYTFLAFHSVAYDQNIPVFLSYPVKTHTPENTKPPFYFTGGFGMEPGDIGTIFTIYGIVCCVVQFVAYPPLATHFGILRCLRLTCK